MHPSQCAARTWLRAQPSQHATGSFPPTKTSGLLDAPTPKVPYECNRSNPAHRSANQHDNLQDSFHRLLDSLDELDGHAILARA